MSETGYIEECCWTDIRQFCKGVGCVCICHLTPPPPPVCGHEAEMERYRQRSRDEDTVRIRLNHERIRLRDVITEALYDYDHGDELGAIDRLRAAIK